MRMEETRGRSLIPQSVRTPLIIILFWSRAIVDWTVPAILRSFLERSSDARRCRIAARSHVRQSGRILNAPSSTAAAERLLLLLLPELREGRSPSVVTARHSPFIPQGAAAFFFYSGARRARRMINEPADKGQLRRHRRVTAEWTPRYSGIRRRGDRDRRQAVGGPTHPRGLKSAAIVFRLFRVN